MGRALPSAGAEQWDDAGAEWWDGGGADGVVAASRARSET